MTSIDFFVWDTSPFLFNTGTFSIRWYSLFFGLSFFLGYLMMVKIYKRENRSVEDLDNLLIYAFFGTLVGARLVHCFFYEPGYYLSNPLEILKFWQGGLASHGAAIGNFVSIYLYSRRSNVPVSYAWLIDRLLIPSAFGSAAIRLGNFFNSEIVGKPAPDVPWAIVFARLGEQVPRHPTQLYECISYFLIFLILCKLYLTKPKGLKPGLISGVFFASVFSVRFLLEYTKSSQSTLDSSVFLNVGQLLSLPMILLGIYLIYRHRTRA